MHTSSLAKQAGKLGDVRTFRCCRNGTSGPDSSNASSSSQCRRTCRNHSAATSRSRTSPVGACPAKCNRCGGIGRLRRRQGAARAWSDEEWRGPALPDDHGAAHDPTGAARLYRCRPAGEGRTHAVRVPPEREEHHGVREGLEVGVRRGWLPRRIPHDFRRTAVPNLVRSGVPERVAMQMTGHKTRSVFERYNIVCEADLFEAARRYEGTLPVLNGALRKA